MSRLLGEVGRLQAENERLQTENQQLGEQLGRLHSKSPSSNG